MLATMTRSSTSTDTASLILRIGLAGIFIFAAVDAFREPAAWSSYFPAWLTGIIPLDPLLFSFSIGQIILGIAILWRPTSAYASVLGFFALLGIGVTNLDALLIVFRDFGLAFMAAGLAVLEWPERWGPKK